MKRYLKWLLLILAVCIALSSFAACDGMFTEDTPDTPSEGTDDELKPDIAIKNYNKEFYLWIMDDTNKPEFHWVEKGGGEVLSEAIFA